MKMRMKNYGWYVAAIFLVLMGFMQGCCDVFNNCCEEEETIPCLAPHNFKVSEIYYLENTVTLSWEERDNADSYTVLYLENGIAIQEYPAVIGTSKFFTVDTSDINRSFQIFSNCTNCEGEAFVSDTVAIGIDGILREDCPTPTGFDASYDGDSLTITWDAVGSAFYDPTYYIVEMANLLDPTDNYLDEATHPENSVTFLVLPPADGSASSVFEISIYQSCNPESARLIGIVEITHDDLLRCNSPAPISPQNSYRVACPDGTYSGLRAFLNCHCGTSNIDPNCN